MSKLFVKFISRRQKLLLAKKELIDNFQELIITAVDPSFHIVFLIFSENKANYYELPGSKVLFGF